MRRLIVVVAFTSLAACTSPAITARTSTSSSLGPSASTPASQSATTGATSTPTTIVVATTTASTEVKSTADPAVPSTLASPGSPSLLPAKLGLDARTLPGGSSLPVEILPDGRSIQSPPCSNHDTAPCGQLDLYSTGNRQQQRIVDDVPPGVAIPKYFDADNTWLVRSGDSDQAMWTASI